MDRTRVVIADDHPIVREGLLRIITSCPDLEVVAEASNGNEVLEICARLRPDVLLLDVSMPGPGFFEVLRRLRADSDRPAVLVLSVYPEIAFAHRARESGASGYVSKRRSPESLARGIRTVAEGGTFFAEMSGGQARLRPGRTGAAPPVHEQLSPREFQVLLMLGEGLRVSEIAEKLGLSPKTVSTYRGRIQEKTQLSSNAAIVRYVAASGLGDGHTAADGSDPVATGG